MKTLVIILSLAAVCLIAGYVFAQDGSPDVEAPFAKPKPPVRHVVLLKFKVDAPADKIEEIETAFAELKNQIDEIADLEWGTDMSPENLSKGFTHCFLLTFETSEARDAYLPHPAHKAFGKLLRPQLEEALVVDYVAQSP